MSLEFWVYVSRSRLSADEADTAVENIVRVSHERNAALGITGALLHSGTRFAQRIEGPAEAVAELKSSILADPRHDGVTTIAGGSCCERLFVDWTLAFSGRSRFFGQILEAVVLGAERQEHEVDAAIALLFSEFARAPE